MPVSPTDFKKGLDLTTVGISATASQFNQLIDQATPQDDRGIIIQSQDSALGVPVVPDAATTTAWQRYMWKRNKHASDPNQNPEVRIWYPSAGSDATYKKWNILVTSPTVDPRDYGADPTGVLSSTAALRKAIYAARANGGSVKLADGTYLLGRDVAYGAGESTPFLYNTDYACRLYTSVCDYLVPLLDRSVLTSDGGAIIKAPIVGAGNPIYMFCGYGYEEQIIEGLVIDGQCELQGIQFPAYTVTGGSAKALFGYPVGTYDIHTGGQFNPIGVGNRSKVRHNSIKNFGGFAPVPTDTVYTAIKPYDNQTSFLFGEPSAIVVASECECHDNRISKCWFNGIVIAGSMAKVSRNRIEDISGIALNAYVPQYDNCSSGSQGFNYGELFSLYMLSKYQQNYKGIDLGSDDGIASGFFCASASNYNTDPTSLYTATQLDALSTRKGGGYTGPYSAYDKSAARYFGFNSVFENNYVARMQLGGHHENMWNIMYRGNQFVQGVPQLPKCGADCPLPLINGSYLTLTGQGGIIDGSIAGDTIIVDNDFYLNGALVPRDATPNYNKWICVHTMGRGVPLGWDGANLGADQVVQQVVIIKNNRIHGAGLALLPLDFMLPLNNTYGSYNYINIDSVCYNSDSVASPTNALQPITEYILDGNTIDGYDLTCGAPVISPIGRFNFLTTQLDSRVESLLRNDGVFGAADNTFGTKQPMLRAFILRKDATWHLDYNIKLRKKDDTSFLIYEKGIIRFRYVTGAVQLFERTILDFAYDSGIFEWSAAYDALFPTNRIYPTGRTLATMYRGGLAVYASVYASGILGYNVGAYANNANLIFECSGEMIVG